MDMAAEEDRDQPGAPDASPSDEQAPSLTYWAMAEPVPPTGEEPDAALGRPRRSRGWRSRKKTVGAAAAAAVLAVGGLTAGGVTLASRANDSGAATAAGSSRPNMPPHTRHDGSRLGGRPGTSPYGTNGFGGDGSDGDSVQSDTTDATTSASAGMVEISSTLSNGIAAGTGMVLTTGGEVVTNHHVVAGATSIRVTVVSTGRTYTARYVGSDATADVAVLQLQDASGLATVTTDVEAVSAGASITAVGDANGDGGSLTSAAGTVTAQDQSITVRDDDGTGHRLTGLIQLSADIVPGDSGGAVLNPAGEVVGMNVAASSGTANVTGYAIPMATVMTVVRQVEAGQGSGSVTLGYDGYLGIGLAQSAASTRVVQIQDGGAASRAGMVVGDTITAVDGSIVSSADALASAIRAHAPGEKVRVSWTTSSGEKQTASATLGRAPIA
jgi:S1-C subfamily serine protease